MNKLSDSFSEAIGSKARRKLRARETSSGVWFGLGTIGLVGWSVVVPTLIGAAIGIWLDQRVSKGAAHTWTLPLLVAGLCIGCFNAWSWVVKEDRAMHLEQDESEGDQ